MKARDKKGRFTSKLNKTNERKEGDGSDKNDLKKDSDATYEEAVRKVNYSTPVNIPPVWIPSSTSTMALPATGGPLLNAPGIIIEDISKEHTHPKQDMTFYKVLSWLSILTSFSMAYLAGWEFQSLVTRFEYLRWLILGYHPGLK